MFGFRLGLGVLGCHKLIGEYLSVVYLVFLLTLQKRFYMVVHTLFLLPTYQVLGTQYFHI